MVIQFADVLEAYETGSIGSPGEQQVFLDKETGKNYFHFENGDNFEELPEDIEDDKYIEIPHKFDLDLGKYLALDFASQFLPSEADYIQGMFRRRGAYSQFKNYLEHKDLLDDWYKFETEKTEIALRKWCAMTGKSWNR